MITHLKNILEGRKLIKSGYNHNVFLSENETGKYIIHEGKPVRDSGSDLSNAYTALRFLESNNISFVPKVIYFDAQKDILIQTYVGDHDVVFGELTNQQLDLFIQNLVSVHSFTQEEIQEFCISLDVSMLQVQTPCHSLHIFGEERFEVVKQLCPDKGVLAWIEPKLKKNIAATHSILSKKNPMLSMGDIGGNIRSDETDLYLIDWEFAALRYDHELAYIKIHSHPTSAQFHYMVERYAHHSDHAIDLLYQEIGMNEKITRVNDVIWAAMKWGQNIDNSEEVEKYKALTFKRMALYEAL